MTFEEREIKKEMHQFLGLLTWKEEARNDFDIGKSIMCFVGFTYVDLFILYQCLLFLVTVSKLNILPANLSVSKQSLTCCRTI